MFGLIECIEDVIDNIMGVGPTSIGSSSSDVGSLLARMTAQKYCDILIKQYNCATTIIGSEVILIAKHREKEDSYEVFLIDFRGHLVQSFCTNYKALKKFVNKYLKKYNVNIPS